NKAKETASEVFFASDTEFDEYESDLVGDYQIQNKKTVLQTVEVLQRYLSIHEDNVASGLLNVQKNTGFMGRWQILNTNPTVVCDTAHNSHGLKIVLNQIARQQYDTLRIVFGVVNDKDLTE